MKKLNRAKRLVVAAGCFGAFAVVYFWVGEHLRWQATASAPVGLYRLWEGPVDRGDLVVACLPEEVGVYGRERGFLRAGRCPGRFAEVVKTVGAVAGDTVLVEADQVILPGEVVLPWQAQDSRGRLMGRLDLGPWSVQSGEVWLYSGYTERSWDSRYYGPVSRSGLRRAELVWGVGR